MTAKQRWQLAATIGFPLLTITAYLLWVWPSPRGTSLMADLAPYLLSLLTGLPFAWAGARGRGRAWLILAYLGGGCVVLWVYAVAVLCGVRGVCL